MQHSLCQLWDTEGERKNTLNLIGNYVSLPPENELFEVLAQCGVEKVLHWSEMPTYEEYKEMGKSRWNLVLRPEGKYAADQLQPLMDYRFVPVSYDLDQIDAQYAAIFDMMGKQVNLTPWRERALAAVEKARVAVGSRSIAVGASATGRPYSMAMALRKYGFHVSDVFTGGGCAAYEQESYDTLCRDYPNTQFHSIFAPENVRTIGHMGAADIAIGYSAGYHTGAPIVVDLMTDEGMFGYHGVVCLMERLCRSIENPQALEVMIESYGLIV